ncbi:MAG: hypothetical protein AVDCRST_MAG27-4343 [uncultured Craurococcus sp.]|uniref:Uncharacterized protein n=1 Tax=uncultured Craurococcus sp. TaxID=1135998 RepID=A0A6J4JTX0_9PROT|nr:MAG: hypothetical protein AVDCRST_MAG27-4343 [uncultured Craurococcus sp.]
MSGEARYGRRAFDRTIIEGPHSSGGRLVTLLSRMKMSPSEIASWPTIMRGVLALAQPLGPSRQPAANGRSPRQTRWRWRRMTRARSVDEVALEISA